MMQEIRVAISLFLASLAGHAKAQTIVAEPSLQQIRQSVMQAGREMAALVAEVGRAERHIDALHRFHREAIQRENASGIEENGSDRILPSPPTADKVWKILSRPDFPRPSSTRLPVLKPFSPIPAVTTTVLVTGVGALRDEAPSLPRFRMSKVHSFSSSNAPYLRSASLTQQNSFRLYKPEIASAGSNLAYKSMKARPSLGTQVWRVKNILPLRFDDGYLYIPVCVLGYGLKSALFMFPASILQE